MCDNQCRICMTFDENCLIELFSVGNECSYAERYTFCSGIEISEFDELPKKICTGCLESVLLACETKENCIQSDAILRQQLKDEPTEYLVVTTEESDHISDIYSEIDQDDSCIVEEEYLEDEDVDKFKESIEESPKYFTSLSLNTFNTNYPTQRKLRDVICCFCDKLFDKIANKNLHIKTEHNTKLECTVCHTKKSSALAAERCIKDHKFGFDFLCQICARSFRRRCDLVLHESLKHKDHELYTCDLCGTRSKYRENLIRHMKSVHSTIARDKYSCPSCPEKVYTNQTSLNIHLYREHDVQAPIICSQCNLGFTFVSELKRHQSRCRGKPSAKKISRNANFSKFCEVVPDGFKCKECPRVFETKQKWSDHYSSKHKIQDESKRYCEACDRMFGCIANYKRHVRSLHEKIKQFKCGYPGCGKAYTSNKNLRDHTNTHTSQIF